MSERKTSEPEHSSWTLRASFLSGLGMSSGFPNMYTVVPPIGGKNVLISGLVINSGYMPLVSSKSARRSSFSVTPNLLATPGKYQTGSTAIFVTAISPFSFSTILPSGFRLPFLTSS
ncbi:hypothetical protein OGATHE_006044 [Ogataea polymorpha]|uniref:Uncharacterized protein n=1 Tax=Ogataea polymorpha TaxID=460523 RepID=A0A9P8SY61_9ASCO|nr:hypothetical protein OGATHE_006044 [Ogataea polymorpha]